MASIRHIFFGAACSGKASPGTACEDEGVVASVQGYGDEREARVQGSEVGVELQGGEGGHANVTSESVVRVVMLCDTVSSVCRVRGSVSAFVVVLLLSRVLRVP